MESKIKGVDNIKNPKKTTAILKCIYRRTLGFLDFLAIGLPSASLVTSFLAGIFGI
jgi:hypothetical protein